MPTLGAAVGHEAVGGVPLDRESAYLFEIFYY